MPKWLPPQQSNRAAVQIKHKSQENQRGQQITHHIAQRTHGDFFNENHIGTKDRTDFADVPRCKITHWQFSQMAAQLHALIRKHQISCCALQAVTEIVNKHLYQYRRNKADPYI